MDPSALASEIGAKVAADTSFWVAIVGLVGVLAGAALGIVGSLLLHWLQDRPRKLLDEGRKKLLLQMLRDTRFQDRWRKMATLSRVIGADEETTKRLLIEVGARGSEKDDGLWGLIESHPFDQVDR